MNKKQYQMGFVAVLSLSAAVAEADSGSMAFYDYATVINVDPVYRVVRRPVADRECWDEIVTHQESGYRSPTGMIVGGIVGGVVGHQFGRGRGNNAATVAGTLLGGAIGNDMTRVEPRAYSVTEQRCRVSEDYVEEQESDGYRVTFRYGERTYTKRFSHDPGKHVRVRVSVVPAE